MTDFTAKFNAELNRLNRQQRQAVDTLEGPVLVFAGPGTGKTQVLTLRIANLIHQGLAAPTEILALTFTNAAAANMKSRLVKLIGSSALQVNFSTFHGFCEQVIAANPEYFRFNSGSQPLSDLEQLLILEHLFDTLPLDTLRSPNKKYYAVPLCRQAINDLKRENVSPQVYDELLQKSTQSIQAEIDELSAKKRPPKGKIATLRKKLAKQQELSLVYHGYTQALAAQKRFDFADMILSVSEAFSQHPELLATYQEKYQYLLVDEYQDTNNYQDQILDALASYWGEQANIFVVGDPYQSIFRFQGANLENFLGFAERYPQAQVINLTTGYRCHNLTYQLAYRLTQTMTPLSERWQAQSGLQNFQNLTGKPAILTESVSRDNELINIFTRITGLIDAGVDPSQIAIIYHNNADAQQLMSFAQSYGLAFDVEGGINILESDLIQKLILLLQLVDKPENYAQVDPCCYHLLRWHALGFDELSVIKFIHAVNEKKLSLTQCLLDPGSPVWSQLRQDGVSDVNLRALQEFGQRVVSWSTEKNNLSVTNLLAKILDKGEILAWIRTQKDYLSLLLTLYSFQRAIASWQANQEHFDIAQLLDYLQALEEHHLSIPLKDLDVKQGAITLTTAHKAKGREWQHVFIYGLNKGVWDNVRQKPSIALPAGIIKHQILTEETDEEKRLLYVALTRASVQNYCSWHLREPTDSGDRQREPADFAHWLQEQESAGLVISQPELLDNKQATLELEKILSPPPVIDFTAASKKLLQARARQLVLSITMLNEYLKDSSHFVEKYLLLAPDYDVSPALTFGNCLHRTLEQSFRPVISGQSPLSPSAASALFAQLFNEQDHEPDHQKHLQEGQVSLQVYLQQYEQSPRQVLAVEKKFGAPSPLLLDDIPLTGKIDRIDQIAPGEALVIDYKTGKHHSHNHLLGKTADANLSERERQLPECLRSQYKRQLLFYKLLCQLDPQFHDTVSSGSLEFVKLENNKPSIQNFLLPDEEVEQLKVLIHQVWSEIQALDFLSPAATSSQ